MIENKPIALITGLPGSGKTALIVKFIKQAAEEGRPVFQTGIPELKVPHFPMPPIDEWTEDREDPDLAGVMCPFFTFPPRSLVVLSEAQRMFRPRPSGSKIPAHVAAFETCRHTGVTFIFDTQHPDFIDSHCRKLVGQHIHLLDHGVLGRWHYEWPYTGTVTAFKEAPIKKKYSLPKEVFDLYKSSSLHIKRKYTIPPAIIALVVLSLVLVIGGYRFFDRLNGSIDPQPSQAAPAKAPASPVAASPVAAADAGPAAQLIEFNAVVPGRPETAPAFDALRQVKLMPVVVGCFKTATRCTCQNQQGLDAGLDRMQCEQWLQSPPFDAYDVRRAEMARPKDDPKEMPQPPAIHPQPATVTPVTPA
jgi:zona occludens toxin